jgi:hypothetical protein
MRPDHDPDQLRHRLLETLGRKSPSAVLETAAGLERLCRSVVADLDLTGATITLMGDAGLHGVAAASDPAIRAVDNAQFDVGEGPSRDAFSAGMPVLAYDLALIDGRWPGFVGAAAAGGIAAVYAFPLQLGAVRLGVLTCYSARPRALASEELSVCVIYAEIATDFLIDRMSGTATTLEPRGFLADDVQIRTVVYQAQGMVMVELGVSLAEALARLRGTAFAEGISLNALAAEVVAGRRGLASDQPTDPEPGPPPCEPGISQA